METEAAAVARSGGIHEPGVRRHIALFLSAPSGGGTQRRMLMLAGGFAERGHRVDVVVARSDGKSESPSLVSLVGLDPPAAYLPWIRRFKGLWVCTATPKLARYLRRAAPDVLLSSSTPANLTALWARRLAGVPVPIVVGVNVHVSTATGAGQALWGTPLRALVRRYYPTAEAVIAISRGVATDLTTAIRLPAGRVHTIYNPVDVDAYQRQASEPLDHPWVGAGEPPIVLGVGKLKPQKDYPTLLRAFARLRGSRMARLVILGEGEDRHKLERLAAQLGIVEDFFLPGLVSNPFAWMARASVFVLCSAWEGFSNALVEALACGCPSVSTNCPSGPSEILADGVYGPLVPVGDDAALAEAMTALLRQPPNAASLGARAGEFSVDAAVSRYLGVLLGVCRDHSSRAVQVGRGLCSRSPADP